MASWEVLDRLSSVAVGGAQRPDSFSGLNPQFATAVDRMVQEAAQQGIDLTITSGYRSPELQATLWENALAKYGDPEIADNWVARPGHSMHNKGLAVDFAAAGGGLLRDANSREAQWIKQNAPRFGLAVPLSNEPWQVELAGARGGGGPSTPPPQQAAMPQPAPHNRLLELMAVAQAMPKWQTTRLDPRDFMNGT